MKSSLRPSVPLVLAVMLAGCARAEAPVAPSPAAPTSAQPSPVAPAQPANPPAVNPVVRAVRVTHATATQAEDGAGHLVAATHPVAIEILADAWYGRALDTVLHVGALHFHQYEHPAPDTLRFVAADGDALPAHAELFVQYGDDTASRVSAAQALPAVAP